jgi:hypothetical protein
MAGSGGLLVAHRRPVPWRRILGLSVVILPATFALSRSVAMVALVALPLLVLTLLAGRIRLLAFEEGVVVGGFLVTRRFCWSEITAFSPMVLSTGKPGFTGAVVVDGVNHELLAVQEPGLYEKLRELNELLLASRGDGVEHVPPTMDMRRSDWTRRRQTLWLGPGAAWWPPDRSHPPDP